jgi:hypothetical protein
MEPTTVRDIACAGYLLLFARGGAGVSLALAAFFRLAAGLSRRVVRAKKGPPLRARDTPPLPLRDGETLVLAMSFSRADYGSAP